MPALTPVDAARLKAEILHELGIYAWSLRRPEIDVLARGLGATHAALSQEVRQWCAFLDALRNE